MRDFCVECGGDLDEALNQQAKRRMGGTKQQMPPPAIPGASSGRGAVGAASVPCAAGPASGIGAAQQTGRKMRGGRSRAAAETPQAAGGGRTTRRTAAATPGAMASTPGVAAMTPRLHETPRNVRLGEVILSTNGSPISMINTVKATGKRERSKRATVTVELNDGTEVDLDQHGGVRLEGEARAQAVEQLLQLKAQLDSHLSDLQGAAEE